MTGDDPVEVGMVRVVSTVCEVGGSELVVGDESTDLQASSPNAPTPNPIIPRALTNRLLENIISPELAVFWFIILLKSLTSF